MYPLTELSQAPVKASENVVCRLWRGMSAASLRHGFALALLLVSASMSSAQALKTQNPYKVEAAYLRNFAHYIRWPAGAFAQDSMVWHIGVLGPDPFGGVLEATFEGRTEQGKPFQVHRADRLEDLPPCQIVFIALKDARQRRAVLSALRDKPVLTVGEARNFLNEGGMIRFEVDHRVGIWINLDQARSVLLEIQTKMLEVSRVILEDGVIRHVR